MYRDFSELTDRLQKQERIKKVAVASAQDQHALEAVLQARRDRIVEPVLVGDRDKILALLEQLGEDSEEFQIFHADSDAAAAATAVRLIREGEADFLMKGKLQTADLLRAVVDKDSGLRTGSVMSHMAIHQIPGYHKLLAVTDGGMLLYPNLDEKKKLIQNAVGVFRNLGYETPKVAVLTAVETVNPKMPETVDADALKKMNQSGELSGCIVEGPISYDLTMSKESAEIKGFQSPVTGDADILVVPDIAAGNILVKALVYSAGSRMAGIIVGAKVPIVLTSRGASAEEKYLSLVLSAASVK